MTVVPEPPQTIIDTTKWRGVAFCVAMVGVFAIITGSTPTTFAILLKARGVNPATIGLNAAMTSAGLLCSAFSTPPLVRRMGAVPVAALAVAVVFLALGLMGLISSVEVWFPARFALGAAVGAFYMTNRTWLNAFAGTASRGRVTGLYATVLGGGFALGPFLLAAVGTQGWRPFLVGMVPAAVILVAIGLYGGALPSIAVQARGRALLVNFTLRAPMLVIATGMFALFDQATLALLPTYAAAYGIREQAVAFDLGVLHIGDVALQLAIGWLCDRLGPRTVLAGCAAATALGAILLPLVIQHPLTLWALLFVWGAAAYGLTTASLVELGRTFSDEWVLGGSAAFVMAGGVGGLIGPPIAGGVMALLGTTGLPVFLATAFIALTLAVLLQPVVRQPESMARAP